MRISLFLVTILFANCAFASEGRIFLRGDSNNDGQVNLADVAKTLSHLFAGAELECEDAADSNDDGQINIADAIYTLSYLFGPQASLPEPFKSRGPDPTPDSLGCSVGPILLSHLPRQCWSEPWDGAPGKDIPSKVRAWANKLGAEVLEVRVEDLGVPVCMACGCPEGIQVLVTVPTEEDAEILKKAGFGSSSGPIKPPPPIIKLPPAID